MEIWTVFTGEYDEYRLAGIFATEELANGYVALLDGYDAETAVVYQDTVATELPVKHTVWRAYCEWDEMRGLSVGEASSSHLGSRPDKKAYNRFALRKGSRVFGGEKDENGNWLYYATASGTSVGCDSAEEAVTMAREALDAVMLENDRELI